METERQRARCRKRLERLSVSGVDCDSMRREAIVELQRAIGFDRWCWPLADPETLLPLSGLAEHDFGPGVPRSLELEYSGHDFAAKHVLGRRPNSAGSLDAETGGDLARSPRWDEVLRPVGIGDVATVSCRDEFGCWGWIEAYRDGADRPLRSATSSFSPRSAQAWAPRCAAAPWTRAMGSSSSRALPECSCSTVT
ncbi:MAG: hypothetical protein MSC30_09370 [Gaiellaceae bacterium MAG52_C11]|nr:hypothetical protein [Candidatus Gaiellasilicea maunaloa]